MARNSDGTRKRLLEAAAAEFAAFGIAGARVDRIAASAECNKQLIYAYFGSKEGLFEAVYDAMVVQTMESVPIDAYDLPGYATRLFDRYREHPEVLRLATWYQLEKAAGSAPAATSIRCALGKVAAIREAQEAGAISDRFSPEDLLVLVLKISTVGSRDSPESADFGRPVESLRECIALAVAQLVAP
jgi:AcrR family transcriptional regulator